MGQNGAGNKTGAKTTTRALFGNTGKTETGLMGVLGEGPLRVAERARVMQRPTLEEGEIRAASRFNRRGLVGRSEPP
jgi:hypothetical protein